MIADSWRGANDLDAAIRGVVLHSKGQTGSSEKGSCLSIATSPKLLCRLPHTLQAGTRRRCVLTQPQGTSKCFGRFGLASKQGPKIARNPPFACPPCRSYVARCRHTPCRTCQRQTAAGCTAIMLKAAFGSLKRDCFPIATGGEEGNETQGKGMTSNEPGDTTSYRRVNQNAGVQNDANWESPSVEARCQTPEQTIFPEQWTTEAENKGDRLMHRNYSNLMESLDNSTSCFHDVQAPKLRFAAHLLSELCPPEREGVLQRQSNALQRAQGPQSTRACDFQQVQACLRCWICRIPIFSNSSQAIAKRAYASSDTFRQIDASPLPGRPRNRSTLMGCRE